MRQILSTVSTVAPNTGATTYGSISTAPAFSSTETSSAQPWPTAGTVANLLIRLDVAPGVGKSWVFTLRINGVDTALTCTISDTATTNRDTTHSVSLAAGDRVVLKVVPSGTPTTAGTNGVKCALEFTSTATGESGYGAAPSTVVSGAAGTKYAPVFAGGVWTTTVADATEVIPLAGTITGLVVLASAAPSSGRSETVTLYLNGVKQDGTAATVNTTASVTVGLTTASSSFTLPVVPGDTVVAECVKIGTGFELIACAVRLVATTDGQSIVAGGSTASTTPGATAYNAPGWASGNVWSVTEATFAADGAVTSMTLSGLRVRLSAAPGVGKSYTFSLRVNSASPAGTPSVTISDAATTGTDATGSVSIVDTNRWAMRSVPSGTPTAVLAHWSLIQAPSGPAAVASAQPYVWGPL